MLFDKRVIFSTCTVIRYALGRQDNKYVFWRQNANFISTFVEGLQSMGGY